MRDSFIFYKSFYEAIKELSTEEQATVVLAIMQYQFDGAEPTLEGVPKAIFTLIKPQLDANNTKYENGCKGGAPKGNSNAKKQPKNNLKTTEKQPNENVNENDNVNDNENEKDKKEYEEKLKYNFEILWEAYPRKDEKQKAYKHYKAWIEGKKNVTFGRNKLTNEEMLEAIENYNAYLRDNKIERKYTKMGSTFFNEGIINYLPKEEEND